MSIQQLAEQGLTQVTRWITLGAFQAKLLKKGEYLLRQGQSVDQLFWIEAGSCTVNYTAANGRRYSHGKFGAGERFYGEIEFFTGRPVQFDIRCEEETLVRVVPVQALEQLMAAEPLVGIWISQCLAETYQGVMDQVTSHFMYPLAYNIARDLLEREQGERAEVQLDKVVREAERFGCSERVYRRAVTQLIDLGLIERTNRHLKITSHEKLQRYLASEES